jgi:phage/plasmid-like protein (TIGR03299 family)
MSDNIGTMRDGRASFAFRGDRNDIWHRKGNQHDPSWSVDDWARNSGLNFEAVKVPAYADLSGIPGMSYGAGMHRVDTRHFIARSDNGHILSPQAVTDRYQVVQPREVLDWFQQYVAVDPRFQLDTAGALHSGEVIFATAVFNGETDVAGSKHKMRLLMTTTFDGSGATINRGCTTRTVCNNTLDVALLEKEGGVVRTRHNTKFNAAEVGKELATIAAGFAKFKAMGEAMAATHFNEPDVSAFFKLTLDIDLKAERKDISTRKMNQFEELVRCYRVGTRQENLQPATAWSMLQAVTRYADHNKSVRGDSPEDTRFASSVVDRSGSGALMKSKAVLLLDEMSDHKLLAAVANATSSESDVSAILKQSFRPALAR